VGPVFRREVATPPNIAEEGSSTRYKLWEGGFRSHRLLNAAP